MSQSYISKGAQVVDEYNTPRVPRTSKSVNFIDPVSCSTFSSESALEGARTEPNSCPLGVISSSIAIGVSGGCETGVAGYSMFTNCRSSTIICVGCCCWYTIGGWSVAISCGPGESGGVMGPSLSTISESLRFDNFLGIGWK